MAAPPAGVSESGGSGSGASTREFLHHERACGAGAGRAVDDDLEAIFSEIRKLSGEEAGGAGRTPGEEADDVELLLRKASELARAERATAGSEPPRAPPAVPQIKITTPKDTNKIKKNDAITTYSKESVELKKITKDPPKDARFKNRIRPFSASVIDSKRKESAKINKITPNNSPKKSILLKQEELLEELKDTKERIKSLELLNVQLTDDNKVYRNKLDEVSEKHHILELKLAECEKFISRLGKEYENRKSEMVTLKENEGKLVAELSKEKNERKNLTIQHDKDKSVIQDLQRQCKEMELILRRKHPDSVSALIVASKSSTVEDNKRKLLEERIIRLEGEISDKENNFQTILMTLQDKFSDMKQKYESHIIDVERQLMDDRKVNIELKNRINKVNLLDACVQTESKSSVQTISTQTFLRSTERLSSAVSRLSQNSSIIFSKLREDSYLIATIKGLQAELTTKQRTISKINRETEELRKSLRNLRKEKEVLHNFNPQTKGPSKQTKSVDNILARVNTEMEAELTDLRRQRQTIIMERDSLMQSLKRTNEEFIMLKKKRIQDLHTLQLSHEKELMQMNMQLFPLQEEIQLLNRTVEMLENRIKVADETLLKSKGYRIDQEAGGDNSSNVRRNETLKKRLEGY